MSGAGFQGNPEDFTNAAAAFSQKVEELHGLKRQLANEMEEFTKSWQGQASDAAKAAHETWDEVFGHHAHTLDDIAKKVGEAGVEYAGTEENNKESFAINWGPEDKFHDGRGGDKGTEAAQPVDYKEDAGDGTDAADDAPKKDSGGSPSFGGSTPDSDQPEKQDKPSDLNDQTPGRPDVVTGDQLGDGNGAVIDGAPGLLAGKDPHGAKNTRALPTGLGVGPDGKTLIGGFSFTDGKEGNSYKGIGEFASNTTSMYDLSDPAHPKYIGDLKTADGANISQGSFAFDPATQTVAVAGNTGMGAEDGRAVWEAKYDPANPNGWMQNLHQVGSTLPFTGDGGDRENQIVKLQGGGWGLLDAKNGDGVRLYTADTPGELLSSPKSPVANSITPTPEPQQLPPWAQNTPGAAFGGRGAYGSTVVNQHYDPATGEEAMTVRVSAWPHVMANGNVIDPPTERDNGYFPETYTYTVVVNHDQGN